MACILLTMQPVMLPIGDMDDPHPASDWSSLTWTQSAEMINHQFMWENSAGNFRPEERWMEDSLGRKSSDRMIRDTPVDVLGEFSNWRGTVSKHHDLAVPMGRARI